MRSQINQKSSVIKRSLLADPGIIAAMSLAALGVVCVPRAEAQSSPDDASRKTFEVASIKRNTQCAGTSLNVSPGGRFTASCITLRRLMMFAYNLGTPFLSGGDDWLDSEKFDIIATAPEGSISGSAGRQLQLMGGSGRSLSWMASSDSESARQLRFMVQALLADRFQLKVHTETRQLPVYALIPGKNGPKIQEGNSDSTPQVRFVMGQMTFQNVPMTFLVTMLTELTEHTVVDQTGLKGNYDFTLKWTPDERFRRAAAAAPSDKTAPGDGTAPELLGPSLLTAVQEQLGLKLTATKGPVQVLVVDHAEKPSEN